MAKKTNQITESKSAKKLRKSESGIYILLKIMLLIPFLYSGFFWGLIASINLINGKTHKADARLMLIGIGLAFIGVLLCFFRKYIIQFVFSLAGTICYMISTNNIITRTVEGENEGSIVNADGVEFLSKRLEQRHMPFVFFGVIAAIILVWRLIPIFVKIHDKREEERNAPTESILG